MFHPRPNSKLDSIPSAKGPNLATESTVTFIWAQVEGPRCETFVHFLPGKKSQKIHGTNGYLPTWMVDFCGFHYVTYINIPSHGTPWECWYSWLNLFQPAPLSYSFPRLCEVFTHRFFWLTLGDLGENHLQKSSLAAFNPFLGWGGGVRPQK